jgi:UDP-N-acetylglucosamine 4,6-dehydratase (inverting)
MESNMINDKSILITGGTGSFGKQFIKTVLERYNPRRIAIYSRDEMKQFMMRQEKPFDDRRIRWFIGDVRDKERLYRALSRVDIVIHAAAMKIVPDAEYNPTEAIKTNIYGAQNIIDAAIEQKVSKVVALSTDKAVNPVNLYGATKMVSDKLFVNANIYGHHAKCTFSCVRYGNVMGSRGSVIPFFKEKAKTGEIPITDTRMTRFWITLDGAVQLVVNALDWMQGGEIFVPKIPSMKITDLADIVAPGIPQREIGIRPGEKIHEMLISEDESRHSYEYDDHFTIYPEHPEWDLGTKGITPGITPEPGFFYRSDNNPDWLDKKRMKQVLIENNLL